MIETNFYSHSVFYTVLPFIMTSFRKQFFIYPNFLNWVYKEVKSLIIVKLSFEYYSWSKFPGIKEIKNKDEIYHA